MVNIRYILFPALIFSFSNAEIISNEEGINIAGKQRLISQQIMKDYVMIKSNNHFGNPKEELTQKIKSFTLALSDLKEYYKDNKEVIETLNIVIKYWENEQKGLDIKYLKNDKETLKKEVSEMHKNMNILLKDSNNVVLKITSSNKVEKELNIAGKQRMISQKIAALYLIKSLNLNIEGINESLTSEIKIFKDNLNILEKYSKNTEETTALITKTKKDFIFFEIMNKSSARFIPTLAFKKSNKILKNMDKLTNLYIKIIKEKK